MIPVAVHGEQRFHTSQADAPAGVFLDPAAAFDIGGAEEAGTVLPEALQLDDSGTLPITERLLVKTELPRRFLNGVDHFV